MVDKEDVGQLLVDRAKALNNGPVGRGVEALALAVAEYLCDGPEVANRREANTDRPPHNDDTPTQPESARPDDTPTQPESESNG